MTLHDLSNNSFLISMFNEFRILVITWKNFFVWLPEFFTHIGLDRNKVLDRLEFLHRSLAVQWGMWSFLIVELLPFHSHHIQIKCLVRQIYKIPKLCLIGLLRPFNFAIQMRSPWFDWSEFDKMVMQFILEVIIEKFCSPISLYPLNGKRKGKVFSISPKKWIVLSAFLSGYTRMVLKRVQSSMAVNRYAPFRTFITSSWTLSPGISLLYRI